MKPIRKYGLSMELPEGKLPGFYAQIIKALAEKSPPFDRDKELLIFSTPGDREHAYGIMKQYKIPFDELDLLLLPEPASPEPAFTDYGFVSRSGHAYVYQDNVCLFTLEAEDPLAEPAPARQQMEEHLLAVCEDGKNTLFITDCQSDELMSGIARAYRCTVNFIQLDP
ncbi:hypothetical protein GCM10023310_41510 [Paenibacillus vulneris]|uniref:Uncharacterized protein n=1 Tax=Paenibacillus vulneris TaxID=1133364 RepID=A0ABW3UU63_9BACL